MRVLKTIFLVIFVFIILLISGAFIFLKTFDINRYKPEIIRQLSKNLGREIGLDRIDLQLSFNKGIEVGLKGLSIADGPQFSSDKFFQVNNISLGVDLMAYFKNKQLSVSTVKFDSPRITIIRDKNGALNVGQIAAQDDRAGKTGPGPGASVSQPQQKQEREISVDSLPALLVQSIVVEDAVVKFIDQSFEPPLSVEVSKIGMKIDQFSLTQPFPFQINARAFSNAENVRAQGQAQLDIAHSQVSIKDLAVTSDLSQCDLKALKETLAFIKGASFPEKLSGDIRLVSKSIVLGPEGLIGLSAKGDLNNGSVKFKELQLPFDSIQGSMDISQSQLEVKNFSMNLGEGKITGTGNVKDYLGQQEYQFELAAENINLVEVIDQKSQPVQLQGKVFGKMKGQGKGFDPALALTTLVSEGNWEIKDGLLTDINVLKTVLDKISMLPNLAERVTEHLPDKYKGKLSNKDTVLNRVKIVVSVANGGVVIQSAEMEADEFLLSGQGQLSFDQKIDLRAFLYIPKDLSLSMGEAVPELTYILGDDDRISIPIDVKGPLSKPSVVPDLEYLGKRIYQNKGREELDKILDKVFGGESKREGTTNPNGEVQPAPDQESDVPVERKIIENILDNIFK